MRSTPSLSPQQAFLRTQLRQARWISIGFFLVTAVVLASPAAFALSIGVPVLAFIAAALVYVRSRTTYLGFLCWLWFLTPLLRRLVDYRASGAPTKAMLLAPFLAALIPLFSIVAHWSTAVTRKTAPLLYVAGAVVYGIMVGLSGFKFGAVAQSVVAWAIPLLVAFFLFQERDRFQSLYWAFESAFLGGVFVIGLYGIYQFVFMPAWDALWIQSSDLVSIGLAEPYQVRVFSTMNAPQVFSAFMMAGVLIVLRSRSKFRFAAAPIGVLALILTMSRAAWLGLAVGACYLLFTFTRRQRVQLAIAGGLSLLLCVAAVQIPDVNSMVQERIASLAHPEQDSSYEARTQSFNEIVQSIEDTPYGFGFSPDQASGSNSGSFGSEERDSSIIAVLLSMGWLGALAFGMAVLLLAPSIFLSGGSEVEAVAACRAVLLGLGAEALLNNIFSGPIAFLTWSSVGFCLAHSQLLSSSMAALGRSAQKIGMPGARRPIPVH
jgi:hypothetical protein